jgi:hypothetical protein
VFPEFSRVRGIVIMYAYARDDRERVEYERSRYVRFYMGVRGLASSFVVGDYGYVRSHFIDADLPLWMAREYYRDGSCHFVVPPGDLSSVGADLYLRRCVGHRVRERDVMKYPRLCVLWARRVVGDRWRGAEDTICSDHVAARLYSEFVVCGRLPAHMHNRLVMESYLKRDPVLDPYFSSLGV